MPTKTLVIQAFQQMNLNLIDVLLDDKRTYQEASKEMFLSKLAGLFEEFKAEGDTELLAYPGFCDSEECENKDCRGISFSGNQSNRTIAFVFEGTEEEVIDIYYCSLMARDDKSAEWDSEFSLIISPNEEVGWNPGPARLLEYKECDLAYAALTAETTYLFKEDYLPWMETYHLLFERYPFPPIFDKPIMKFLDLYRSIKNLREYLKFEENAIQALMDYELMDETNEKELLQWLMQYETLGLELSSFPYYHHEEVEYKPIRFSTSDLFVFDHSDYVNLFELRLRFNKTYFQKLDQYDTVECNDAHLFSPANYKHVLSLKYHLERRAML